MSKRRSPLVDTRVVYCGDNLDQLPKLPDQCVDLIYIDPPFNSNRNYEVFWGETKEKRAFADRHASTAAYIDFMLGDAHPVRLLFAAMAIHLEVVCVIALPFINPAANSRRLLSVNVGNDKA
jgi:hypothetical protein